MKTIFLHGVEVNELLLQIEQLIEKKISDFQPYQTKQIQSGFISRLEVAKLLKVSLPTLHEWTKLGWLQSYKIGNRVLYRQDEVENALRKVSANKFKKGGLEYAA